MDNIKFANERFLMSGNHAGKQLVGLLAFATTLIFARAEPISGADGSLTLQILHASDFESSISALEDAPRFSSVVEGLKAAYPTNTLMLASGNNYIPGPFFTASADPGLPYGGVKGRGDILLLNALGFQASSFGVHEFSDGVQTLPNVLLAEPEIGYPGSLFPYLSANLDFTTDSNTSGLITADGQDWQQTTNRVARSTVITVAGQRIGIVGATTGDLPNVTSSGNVSADTNVLLRVQQVVDALTATGIDKVILLSHLQNLTNEFTLAAQLRDVDVIIGGGSGRLLAKETDRLREGDIRAGDYPMTFTSATGEPVQVVNVDGRFRYVGRLVVEFDAAGKVAVVNPASGLYATDEEGVLATGNVPPAAAVTTIITNLASVIDAKDSQVFGFTTQFLNGLWSDLYAEETNLGDLTADANLQRARLTDANTVVSIKNGGGIRDSIGAIQRVGDTFAHVPPLANPRVGKPAGGISQLDIENALRFNNPLTLLTLTAQQLRDALEWGVAGTGAPGQFPQVAGLAFSFDPNGTPLTYLRDTNNTIVGIDQAGTRLQNLVVTNADGRLDLVVDKGVLVGDANRTFRIVTIAFMASGGDFYYPLTQGIDRVELVTSSGARSFTTEGAEQRALADYLEVIETYTEMDRPGTQDTRIQNLAKRGDSVKASSITELKLTGATLVQGFRTLMGKEYIVQEKAALEAEWQDADGVLGDGTVKTVNLPIGTGESRFFQVVLRED